MPNRLPPPPSPPLTPGHPAYDAAVAERRRCTRNAWTSAVVCVLVAVAIVAALSTPAQRGYLGGHVPARTGTVVDVRPAAADHCRGRVERSWDVTLRWREGDEVRTGVASRCGERAPYSLGSVHRLWQRSDGLVTLDSPRSTWFATGFVLLLDLLMGALFVRMWLRSRPDVAT